MAKPTYDDIARAISRYPPDPKVFAPLVSGKNPDGSDFSLPVSFIASRDSAAPIFEEWATRNDYMDEHFSGEVAVPTAGEATLLNLTVPAGETWYRRRTWYSVAGARVGQFKFYRTMPAGVETYNGLVVLRNNDSTELDTYGKYPAGARVRIAAKPDALAAAGDLVTARVQFIKLPWAE